jgi:acyl-CoA synthetase (NDP forming)
MGRSRQALFSISWSEHLNTESDSRPDQWLKLLLEPGSVAVVGASDDIKAPGGRVLRYMLNYGFTGPIYPVNPKRATVQGVPAFASVSDLPARVDLAVIVVPAAAALDALEQCGIIGVPMAMIGSAGFAEAGPEGLELQARLAEIGRRYGIRLVGPNTNGIINCRNGLTATFTPSLDQDDLKLIDGPIAIVSQSGAIGGALFYNAQISGLPVGRLVNTGNEIDVSLEAVIEALIEPGSGIDIVLCYVEGLRYPEAFIRAAKRAALLGKRVVLLKTGATPAGAQAAAAHTASLAGEDRVYDGVLRQFGVVRAKGIAHLLDIGRGLVAYGPSMGRRVTIASMSGGVGIMLTDALSRFDMRLAALSKVYQEELDPLLPAFLGRNNPLDVGGSPFHDLDRLRQILRILDRNPDSDMTFLAIGSFERRQIEIARVLIDESAGLDKPLFVIWFGGGYDAAALLNRSGVPCFHDPDRLVEAVAAAALRPKVTGAAPAQTEGSIDIGIARSLIAEARRSGRRVLDEVAGKKILHAFGLDVVADFVVAGPDECEEALARFRWPVVAKLRSDKIVHKARIGGVRLGLETVAAVRDATHELLRLARDMGVHGAEIVLQDQVASGVELLLGMKSDPTFGPVITLGIGGVLAEAWNDVQIRTVDCEHDVSDMLAGLEHQMLLNGSTGNAPIDPPEVARTVARFCRLVRELEAELDAIDVNPLIIDPVGKRIVAVDAVFFLRDKAADAGP